MSFRSNDRNYNRGDNFDRGRGFGRNQDQKRGFGERDNYNDQYNGPNQHGFGSNGGNYNDGRNFNQQNYYDSDGRNFNQNQRGFNQGNYRNDDYGGNFGGNRGGFGERDDFGGNRYDNGNYNDNGPRNGFGGNYDNYRGGRNDFGGRNDNFGGNRDNYGNFNGNRGNYNPNYDSNYDYRGGNMGYGDNFGGSGNFNQRGFGGNRDNGLNQGKYNERGFNDDRGFNPRNDMKDQNRGPPGQQGPPNQQNRDIQGSSNQKNRNMPDNDQNDGRRQGGAPQTLYRDGQNQDNQSALNENRNFQNDNGFKQGPPVNRNFGGIQGNFGPDRGFGENQDGSGGRFDRNQDNFRGNQGVFGGNRDYIRGNQYGFGRDQDNIISSRNDFGGNQGGFGRNQNDGGFGPRDNQDEFGRNQGNFGGNRDNFDGNRDNFGGNQNDDGFRGNQDGFGGNQDGFGNQRGFGGNSDGFGGNKGEFGDSQRGFGGNSDGFGKNDQGFSSSVNAGGSSRYDSDSLASQVAQMQQAENGNLSRLNVNIGMVSPEEYDQYLMENNVKMVGQPDTRLLQFNPQILHENIYKATVDMGYKNPTPIQAIAIPIALSGRDLVGIAKTGSGKTAAYLIPAIQYVLNCSGTKGPNVLILANSRELVQQIAEMGDALTKYTPEVKLLAVHGGEGNRRQQLDGLRTANIVSANPGRCLDFISNNKLNLTNVGLVVIDEADKMVSNDFASQISPIINKCPRQRQILMWSATWPEEVRDMAEEYLHDYIKIVIDASEVTVNRDIKQILIEKDRRNEYDQMMNIISQIKQQEQNPKLLIFCNSKRNVDRIYENMQRQMKTLWITGDKSQILREKTVKEFKETPSNIALVATDVISRGFDVDDITHVIQFDLPVKIVDYAHRIGRTGRGGRTGVSIGLFDPGRNYSLRQDLVEYMQKAGQDLPDFLV